MKFTSITGLLALAQLAQASAVKRQYGATKDVPQSLQSILDNAHNNPAYTYSTDLTRDIVPKPIHSHNDYWRDVPFFTALSNGCISVEADVWHVNDTLFVGHDQLSLSSARTFDSLYVEPILNVLKRQNPQGQILTTTAKFGVFDSVPDMALNLFVDVKTDGPTTWPVVIKALQPLRDAGYLTAYNNSQITQGVVTVIGTGNTPLNQVQGVSPRDYFFDANLALLNTTQANITSSVSPIASTQFSRYIGAVNGTSLNSTQLATLRSQLAVAKARGIGGRYWDTPAWPISTRDGVWQTLVKEGVALLNADDLPAASGFTGPAW